jgi:hypothetical protein
MCRCIEEKVSVENIGSEKKWGSVIGDQCER